MRGGKLGEHTHTWVALAHVQVVAAADAGGVQRVNAEGGELAPQLLDVALFAVQRHLKLQSDLVLLRQQLKVKKNGRVSLLQHSCSSSSTGALCWFTDRLHVRHFPLALDDGAVEFLLLHPQFQLQLPVLLLPPVDLHIVTTVAPPHRHPPVHHLGQLVHSLKAKQAMTENTH